MTPSRFDICEDDFPVAKVGYVLVPWRVCGSHCRFWAGNLNLVPSYGTMAEKVEGWNPSFS